MSVDKVLIESGFLSKIKLTFRALNTFIGHGTNVPQPMKLFNPVRNLFELELENAVVEAKCERYFRRSTVFVGNFTEVGLSYKSTLYIPEFDYCSNRI